MLERNEVLSAALALEGIGIYPKSVTRNGVTTERTERQDGWNDCADSVNKAHTSIWQWLDAQPETVIDLIEQEAVFIRLDGDEVKMFVLANDLFLWACADAEPITTEELPSLAAAMTETPEHGTILWVCRKRGMRPQKPYYKYFSEAEAKMFDACGPERN